MSSTPPPGWFADPAGGPPRYWDGAQWTTPVAPTPPGPARRKRTTIAIVAVLAAAAMVGIFVGALALSRTSGSKQALKLGAPPTIPAPTVTVLGSNTPVGWLTQ